MNVRHLSLFALLFICLHAAFAEAPFPLHGVVQSGVAPLTVPISGARVTLLAASTEGWRRRAKRLGSTVTGAEGSFKLDVQSCDAGAQIYLLAEGGKPGSGTVNRQIALISVLGACPLASSATGTTLVLNEATTVAATYSLAAFLTDARRVSSGNSTQAVLGLTNAFAMPANLVNLDGTVRAATLQGNGLRVIDDLANLVSTCVNAAGNSASCKTLFSLTTPAGAHAKPRNTVEAIHSIARHTANNAQALFEIAFNQVQSGKAPFSPGYSTFGEYGDWSLPIVYTAWPANATLRDVAVDSKGSVWAAVSSNSVTKIIPGQPPITAGDPTNSSHPGGLWSAWGLAVDRADNIWVGSTVGLNLSEFSSTGAVLSPPAGFPLPFDPNGSSNSGNGAIAIDLKGKIWALTAVGSLCDYDPVTHATCTTPYAFPPPPDPRTGNSRGLTVTRNNDIWMAVHDAGKVGRLDQSKPKPVLTDVIATLPNGSNAFQHPGFLAADRSGRVWVANQSDSSRTDRGGGLIALGPNGKLLKLSRKPITDGGICLPMSMIFAGDDTLWVANYAVDSKPCGNAAISHFTRDGKPLAPYGVGYGQFTAPFSIAIDPSGNLWATSGESNSLVELIGATVPVVTPLNPARLGKRP